MSPAQEEEQREAVCEVERELGERDGTQAKRLF
jgi:hypothetical protein